MKQNACVCFTQHLYYKKKLMETLLISCVKRIIQTKTYEKVLGLYLQQNLAALANNGL